MQDGGAVGGVGRDHRVAHVPADQEMWRSVREHFRDHFVQDYVKRSEGPAPTVLHVGTTACLDRHCRALYLKGMVGEPSVPHEPRRSIVVSRVISRCVVAQGWSDDNERGKEGGGETEQPLEPVEWFLCEGPVRGGTRSRGNPNPVETRWLLLSDFASTERDEAACVAVFGAYFDEQVLELESVWSGLVGVEPFKDEVRRIVRDARLAHLRQEPFPLGAVANTRFEGKPGTGKTTAASMLGRLLWLLGQLRYGHSQTEPRITPGDFTASYLGQTTKKARGMFSRFQGGLLFMDEAYTLSKCGDYKDDAANAILTCTERPSCDAGIMLVAGYEEEMEAGFFGVNPGLRRRFQKCIGFPAFTVKNLVLVVRRKIECSPPLRQPVEGFYGALELLLSEDNGLWENVNASLGDILLTELHNACNDRNDQCGSHDTVFTLADLHRAYTRCRNAQLKGRELEQRAASEKIVAQYQELLVAVHRAERGEDRRRLTVEMKHWIRSVASQGRLPRALVEREECVQCATCPWCAGDNVARLHQRWFCVNPNQVDCAWDFPVVCPMCQVYELTAPTSSQSKVMCPCGSEVDTAAALVFPVNGGVIKSYAAPSHRELPVDILRKVRDHLFREGLQVYGVNKVVIHLDVPEKALSMVTLVTPETSLYPVLVRDAELTVEEFALESCRVVPTRLPERKWITAEEVLEAFRNERQRRTPWAKPTKTDEATVMKAVRRAHPGNLLTTRKEKNRRKVTLYLNLLILAGRENSAAPPAQKKRRMDKENQ